MNAPGFHPASSKFRSARIIAVVALGGGLILAAQLIGPAGSNATTVNDAPAAPVDAPDARLRPVAGPALLGTLQGGRYRVDVFMVKEGPRYTVKDAQGQALAELVTSDEITRRFPDLDVSGMKAGAHADVNPRGDDR